MDIVLQRFPDDLCNVPELLRTDESRLFRDYCLVSIKKPITGEMFNF